MTDAAPAAPAAVVRPRSYTAALGLLAVGAVLLFVASGRTWVTVVVAEVGLPSTTVTIAGNELTGGAPLALVALAGIAGLVALRRVGRIIAGIVLLLCAVAYAILERTLISLHGKESTLSKAFGRSIKEWISMVAYAVAIPMAFVEPRFSGLVYVVIAATWIVPDRRIEKVLAPRAS